VASKDLVFSSEKIRSLLGWKPKIGLDEGIKRTVEWYKKAKSQWLKI